MGYAGKSRATIPPNNTTPAHDARWLGSLKMWKRACATGMLVALSATASNAQELSFRFETSEQEFTPLHSYVAAEVGSHDAMFFCGITGFGMHVLSTPKGPAPIFALKPDYNQDIILVDEDAGTMMSGSLAHLSATLRDALLVTNPSAYQHGDTLYIYGGYGPNSDGTDVVTKPNVIEVDLLAVRAAIIAETPIPEAAFTVTVSEPARAAGAEIFPLEDGRFVLYGGANFAGDYPSHTIEQYTDAMQVFDLSSSSTVPVQTIVSEDMFVTTDLHRRDLNGYAATSLGARGARTYGFTVTGGVFKFGFAHYDTPVTWMDGDTYAVEDTGSIIKLNLYHGPTAGFFAESAGQNRLVHFGGITAYDTLESEFANFGLPWSDMVSECVFDGTTFVEERVLGNTPAPIAVGHFIENRTLPTAENTQIELDQLPPAEIRLGAIFGGIHAAEATENPMTWASSEVVDVYMVKGVRGDISGNGVTDAGDLAELLAAWGGGYGTSDLNWDGIVDAGDIAVLLSYWGRDYPG